jgi:long-chain acyl-CoA synthetase
VHFLLCACLIVRRAASGAWPGQRTPAPTMERKRPCSTRAHAQATPEKAACVFADATAGQAPVLTYAALKRRQSRSPGAAAPGLARGEGMALMLDNTAEVFTIGWAAERAGLYCTSISHPADSPADAAYIVADSGARVLVASIASPARQPDRAGAGRGATPAPR